MFSLLIIFLADCIIKLTLKFQIFLLFFEVMKIKNRKVKEKTNVFSIYITYMCNFMLRMSIHIYMNCVALSQS